MALAWGQPLEYIESLPESTYREFMALNAISPFTYEAQAQREGLIATLLYNNNISKKKDAKTVADLFPYLSGETPEWLEDERVRHAKNVLRSIKCHSVAPEKYKENYAYIVKKIQEEIDLELKKPNPDSYVINKLKNLIGENNGR